ncbi:MAG: heme lyase CcmF/NrfE family subunit [Myxococcota bacterium]|nr:heme lyase CcmF/NrfE family subunit [Myxococcota bacterium]
MSDLGFYTLQLTFLIASAGLIAGILGGALRRGEWARVAVRAMLLTFGATSLAIVCLFYAFATLDLQLSYVASHASRDMPTFYRIAALWGGQAGSLLLWLWMLTAYGALAVWINRRSERLIPWVCAALQTNVVFFLILLNFVSNPFDKLPPEAVLSDGAGLNPLLQHPVMLIHPLVLYMGLTGFAVPFAFGLGAMLTGQIGTAWLRTTRRWTLFAWCFLSIGILLGGRWAYEVLGWGGYWAWDPVENASFMPWLAATAYLHSVMVQEKRDMLKTWNLVLVGMTYILCIFGTMLTRSGLVRSVHAFAQTEIFGILFLGYVLLTTLVFYGVLFWRRPLLRSQNQLESVVSRESGFLINNWIFMAILGVVFCGTLFPKVTEWFGKEILVGPAYFNAVSAPLALMLLVLTGIGPLIAWRRATLSNLQRQFIWPSIVGVATGVVLVIALGADAGFFPLLTWALSAFVVASLVQEYWRAIRGRMRRGENPGQALATLMRKNQRRYGGYVVHLGVVFIFIGIAGAAFNEERLENLAVGDEVAMNGYRLSYRTAKPIPMQHYGGAEARIALYHGDEPLVTMTPEKRMYWLEQQPASIPSVYSTLQEDLYVILTAIEPDGSATLKIYRNPLVNWIWIGGYTFVFGTILIMWPHPERSSGRPA